MENRIIKNYKGKKIYLVHTDTSLRGGILYKNSYWRTIDDTKHFTFECKIPEGYEDIDLSTLKMDCISGNEEIVL